MRRRVVANDEKTVEQPKCDGWHGEEIHGRDGLTVILQKCQPPFRGVRVAWGPLHRSRYRSFGDVESQFEQFAVNTRRTPGGILGLPCERSTREFLYRFAFGGELRPPSTRASNTTGILHDASRIPPVGDVVVLGVLAQNGSLYCVSRVVDHEDEGLKVMPQDGRELCLPPLLRLKVAPSYLAKVRFQFMFYFCTLSESFAWPK